MASRDQNVLLSFIKDLRWDDAMERTKTLEGKEDLRMNDEGGQPPLNRACQRRAPFALVEAMVDAYPEAVKIADNRFGVLPLHFACGLDVPIPVVRLLLEVYPEGAKKATNSYGMLPLHWAADSRAPVEVLRMLVDTYPEGAASGNAAGQLPLHRLAVGGVSTDSVVDTEKVAILLRPILDNEEACMVSVPSSGGTPLHIAARFRLLSLHECMKRPFCPPDVIMTVARRHPGQLGERDANGSLPLHMAAANPLLNGVQVEKEDLIGSLVKLYPAAAASSSKEARSPLALAIESGKKWQEGVEAITDAAEHVITSKDDPTKLFPFMLAATVDNPCITSVYSLLRRCPELERYVID